MAKTRGELNVLLYERRGERWVWLFRDDQVGDVLRSLGRFASNHDLSFTWWDAVQCSEKLRRDRERMGARHGRDNEN